LPTLRAWSGSESLIRPMNSMTTELPFSPNALALPAARLRFGWVVCIGGLCRLLCSSHLDIGEAELPNEFDQDADADQDVEDREDLDRAAREDEFRGRGARGGRGGG